ncbi:hypothetical protein [Leucothrix pacifica]|uniref:PCI domain-containing protein n=1 Tax=Leucothrix pacifica TaxID=1247513 RepID=A0A317C9U8_9GAMM|nr:hypothetical protein [Leucothrix pacifica]PWQ92832.1 hypothetical protein DKW60_18995 [Leucothrix pacifica]
MHCYSTIGKGLFGLALFFVVGALLTLFDNDSDSSDATLGFIMFAALAGIPGWIFCRRANRKQSALVQQLQGFIRSRDSFSMAELANAIDLDEQVARKKVLTMIQNQSLDLVFDTDTERYMRRDKLAALKVIESCGSCGSQIAASRQAEHQLVNCPYCGKPI